MINLLIEKYGREQFRSIFLYKKDLEKFVTDITKSTTPNDWILAKTKEKTTFPKIAKMISYYGQYFETEAKKYNFPVLNMDNDFEGKLVKAIDILTK